MYIITKKKIDEVLLSDEMENLLMDEEIKSLESGLEHLGVFCLDDAGNIVEKKVVSTRSTNSSAETELGIKDLGNICQNDKGIWWHTHVNTLSSMSLMDRISSGYMKVIGGDSVLCASGIEGYSCHNLNLSPPKIINKKWSDNSFKKLKLSSVSEKILDISDDWSLEEVKESNADHVNCTSKDGILFCEGVDWKSGVQQFDIGVFNQVVISGNVDIMPTSSGFMLLSSPIDKKLECMKIKVPPRTEMMYCR